MESIVRMKSTLENRNKDDVLKAYCLAVIRNYQIAIHNEINEIIQRIEDGEYRVLSDVELWADFYEDENGELIRVEHPTYKKIRDIDGLGTCSPALRLLFFDISIYQHEDVKYVCLSFKNKFRGRNNKVMDSIVYLKSKYGNYPNTPILEFFDYEFDSTHRLYFYHQQFRKILNDITREKFDLYFNRFVIKYTLKIKDYIIRDDEIEKVESRLNEHIIECLTMDDWLWEHEYNLDKVDIELMENILKYEL